jgi:REP element-mobilizing transposase RayT
MDVQAAYLQWVMITPPEIAPVSFMSRIQEHTSRWVFQSYPDLINQNPSGEFWAVGKVILSGRYLLSRATIENVVQKIRAQQGR